MTTAEDLGIQGLNDVEALDIVGSVLFRARQPAQSRDVVVKILDAFQEPLIPRRFDLRRKALAKFAERSGVVPVYEVGTTPKGQQYLLMPYFAAGSLADRLAEGAMAWRQAAHLMARTALVVAEGHDLGVVLGDLKPSSILLDEASTPTISVYGMATRRFDDGRPSYAAPENRPGSTLTPAADVYSLSLTLAALIAGRHPSRGRPTDDFQTAYRNDSPAWLAEVIDTGLSAEAGDRQGDARALAIALQNGLRTDSEPMASEPAESPGLTLDLDELLGDAEQGDIVLSGLGRSTKDDDEPDDPFDFEALLELPIRPDEDAARPKIDVDELLDLDDVLGVADIATEPDPKREPKPEPGSDGETAEADAAAGDTTVQDADDASPESPSDNTAAEAANDDQTVVLGLPSDDAVSEPAIDLRLDDTTENGTGRGDGDDPHVDDDGRSPGGGPDAASAGADGESVIDLTEPDEPEGGTTDSAGVTVGAPAEQATEPTAPPAVPADGPPPSTPPPPSPTTPPPPGPPTSAPATPGGATAKPAVAATAETSLFDQPRVPAAEPNDEIVVIPPPTDQDATTVMDAPDAPTTEAVLIEDDDSRLFGPGPAPSTPSMPFPGVGRVGADEPATSIWDGDPEPAAHGASGTGAPEVTRLDESETTLFPARHAAGANQGTDPNYRLAGGTGADPDRILGGGLPPTGSGAPYGGVDRRLASTGEIGTVRRVLDTIGALWVDRRPGLSGLVAFLSFLAIAGVVIFLIAQDLRGSDTTTATDLDGPGTTIAATSEDSIEDRVEPTSVAPVLPEPASTHVTSAGRGTARRLTTTVAITLPPSTTTTASATSEGASTTAAQGATTVAEGEEGALPPLGPQASPEGPTDPSDLIRNADVSQVGATSARIAFDSPACVTVLFTYSAAGGGPTSQVSGGTRCSTEHTLLLGTVTAPLEPGTAYTVVITASDGDTADRAVVTFSTGA